MAKPIMDLSTFGWGRVIALSTIGTLCCIVVAFAIDSYSLATGTWRWGESPLNNVIIPLVLAPPFFGYLLGKQRELAIAHRELMIVASTDALTSCLNRRAFMAIVDGFLDRVANRKIERLGALLVIDVDHFKLVNDRFGHDGGDEALKLIVQIIKGSVREFDVIGRIGGEEFSVLLPGVGPDTVGKVAERIRAAVYDSELKLEGESLPPVRQRWWRGV